MDPHTLLLPLARAVATLLTKAYGAEATTALAPTPANRAVRSLLGHPTGTDLLMRRVLKRLEGWLTSSEVRRSPDAVTEAISALTTAVSGYSAVDLTVESIKAPDLLAQNLRSRVSVHDLRTDGADAFFDRVLSVVVDEVQKLAPKAEGLGHYLLQEILRDVESLKRQAAHDGRAISESIDDLRRHLEVEQLSPFTPPDVLIRYLSEARMARYRSTMRNDSEALRLYAWNTDVSAEAYRWLHLVEVILRNAIDQQLCRYNASAVANEDWIYHPASLVNAVAAPSIQNALREADRARTLKEKRGIPSAAPSHDDVIAHFSFAAWRQM